jgi:hypothetical protein
MFERNRTKPFLIRYAFICIFLDCLRNTSKALEPFVDRSYVAIWYWIQEFDPKSIYPNKKKSRITAYIIDETQIQIGIVKLGYGLQQSQFIIKFLGLHFKAQEYIGCRIISEIID